MTPLASLPHSTASRTTGFGIVIAIHVVALIALSNGLIHHLVPKDPGPLVVRLDPQVTPPPPPLEPVKTLVRLSTPDVPPITPPTLNIAQPPIMAPQPTPAGSDLPGAMYAPQAAPQRGSGVDNSVKPATAVCTKMLPPEMPAVGWSGEALFRAVASTHAGRVTTVEVQSLRGGMDSRSLRAFKGAIEAAINGYECPGDVRFEQEFQFRVE